MAAEQKEDAPLLTISSKFTVQPTTLLASYLGSFSRRKEPIRLLCNNVTVLLPALWVFLSLAASIHYKLCQGGLIHIGTWSQFGINSKGGCLDQLYDCGGNIYIWQTGTMRSQDSYHIAQPASVRLPCYWRAPCHHTPDRGGYQNQEQLCAYVFLWGWGRMYV